MCLAILNQISWYFYSRYKFILFCCTGKLRTIEFMPNWRNWTNKMCSFSWLFCRFSIVCKTWAFLLVKDGGLHISSSKWDFLKEFLVGSIKDESNSARNKGWSPINDQTKMLQNRFKFSAADHSHFEFEDTTWRCFIIYILSHNTHCLSIFKSFSKDILCKTKC